MPGHRKAEIESLEGILLTIPTTAGPVCWEASNGCERAVWQHPMHKYESVWVTQSCTPLMKSFVLFLFGSLSRFLTVSVALPRRPTQLYIHWIQHAFLMPRFDYARYQIIRKKNLEIFYWLKTGRKIPGTRINNKGKEDKLSSLACLEDGVKNSVSRTERLY